MRVMTLGGLGSHGVTLMPRNLAPSAVIFEGRPQLRGLGEVGITDALGVGVIAFVVGGAIGFALGAGVTASASRRW